MLLKINGNNLEVTREKTDPKVKASQWNPDTLSSVLYRIAKYFNAAGCDLIKKRMAKDGHLVDDMQHYLRTRKATSKGPHIYITDNLWNIRDIAEDYNACKPVQLEITFDVYSRQPDCKKELAKVAKRLNTAFDATLLSAAMA
jgi:hypothetical protein